MSLSEGSFDRRKRLFLRTTNSGSNGLAAVYFLAMWSSSGTKLTGSYGTWRGQEVEVDSTTPYDRTILLIKYGGNSPGVGWMTIDHGDQFPSPGVRHSLRVPYEEVSNIHAVRATGELSPRGVVTIHGEDQGGNLAVITKFTTDLGLKERLLKDHGFHTFHDEPVTRSAVFGWLQAALVGNIKSEVSWRKDDDL
ncbi:hypothetical protein [Arthrobacter sp. zg-Y844]|uniref:hypothetical protein n=1 Tax=Arthrobacter sp. zg-Y844 TaxID=2964612 RepID=UPI002104548A|nr:hypothetical protein [Arthrobacter sp. zg-Y844]MCQ1987853.1 hypothetical protein [Arthrobacter sp. zg-Y844]